MLYNYARTSGFVHMADDDGGDYDDDDDVDAWRFRWPTPQSTKCSVCVVAALASVL